MNRRGSVSETRRFETSDLGFALKQISREGWAASREQFEIYLEHDPDGCFIATMNGKPVGMVTTTSFGSSGWIGNLIVEPENRGAGIGRTLMELGLQYLRKMGCLTIRLDGDAPGIPLYRSLGFEDEYESCRFEVTDSRVGITRDSSGLETMNMGDLNEVNALDAGIVGADRSRFLRLKYARSEYAVVKHERGSIVASLMASKTDRGLRLGPCVAQSSADAKILIVAALATAGGRTVMVGVPGPNAGAHDLFEGLGFTRTPSSLRMRLGPRAAEGDPHRLFAISSGAEG
ncbi:MAG: GNAT family N-acetyltransferase [bacterium]|nr:GNAT family N-acetyltransferase [bacterium]